MQHQSNYDRIVNSGKKTGQGASVKNNSWPGCLSEQTEIRGDMSAKEGE